MTVTPPYADIFFILLAQAGVLTETNSLSLANAIRVSSNDDILTWEALTGLDEDIQAEIQQAWQNWRSTDELRSLRTLEQTMERVQIQLTIVAIRERELIRVAGIVEKDFIQGEADHDASFDRS